MILTGWRVDEVHWGGYATKARVKSDWLVPLPKGMSLKQAMAIGTAGFTAMLAVMALEEHGLKPENKGEVLVTGAAGGVGSIAVALLANLGYGSRKEVQAMIRSGVVTDDTGLVLGKGDIPPHDRIRVRGEALDPPSPLVLVLNKPDGFTCSYDDPGDTIYDLLPPRYARRNPGLNSVGRLDKDTTGLLLLTDDGKLLHRIIHPKSSCLKIYHVILDRPIEGHEKALFASGELMLNGENKALLPAPLEVLGDREALVTLHEVRYH